MTCKKWRLKAFFKRFKIKCPFSNFSLKEEWSFWVIQVLGLLLKEKRSKRTKKQNHKWKIYVFKIHYRIHGTLNTFVTGNPSLMIDIVSKYTWRQSVTNSINHARCRQSRDVYCIKPQPRIVIILQSSFNVYYILINLRWTAKANFDLYPSCLSDHFMMVPEVLDSYRCFIRLTERFDPLFYR